MTFLPDYGLALKQSGLDGPHYFLNFKTDNITKVGQCNFTTLVIYPMHGVDHALSLDFNEDHLLKILEQSQPKTVDHIMNWLNSSPIHSTIQIPESLSFGCKAVLGEVQSAPKEQYLPLLLEEII